MTHDKCEDLSDKGRNGKFRFDRQFFAADNKVPHETVNSGAQAETVLPARVVV